MSAAANVVSSGRGWRARPGRHVLTVKTLHVNGERAELRLPAVIAAMEVR